MQIFARNCIYFLYCSISSLLKYSPRFSEYLLSFFLFTWALCLSICLLWCSGFLQRETYMALLGINFASLLQSNELQSSESLGVTTFFQLWTLCLFFCFLSLLSRVLILFHVEYYFLVISESTPQQGSAFGLCPQILDSFLHLDEYFMTLECEYLHVILDFK